MHRVTLGLMAADLLILLGMLAPVLVGVCTWLDLEADDDA